MDSKDGILVASIKQNENENSNSNYNDFGKSSSEQEDDVVIKEECDDDDNGDDHGTFMILDDASFNDRYSNNENDDDYDIKEEEEEEELDDIEDGYETRSEVASSATSEEDTVTSMSDKFDRKMYNIKLNCFFRDARFYLMKSNNTQNINIAKEKNVWSTLPINRVKLEKSFNSFSNVILIFSAKGTGKFSGFARISSGPWFDHSPVDWHLPDGIKPSLLSGIFKLDWICRNELPFSAVSHLRNPWNLYKQVKIGRDGQLIAPTVAQELCRKFPIDENIDLNLILRKARNSIRMKKENGRRNNNKEQGDDEDDDDGRLKERRRNLSSNSSNNNRKRNRSVHKSSYLPRPPVRPYPYVRAGTTVFIPAAAYHAIPPVPYAVPPPSGPPRYYEPLSMLANYTGKTTMYNNYLSYNIGSHSILQNTSSEDFFNSHHHHRQLYSKRTSSHKYRSSNFVPNGKHR